jgi:hypothetical protein
MLTVCITRKDNSTELNTINYCDIFTLLKVNTIKVITIIKDTEDE